MTQDYAEGMRWYRAAAEQGKVNAQFRLGLIYHDGYGVVQDHVAAHMWLNLAAANGHERAHAIRDVVVADGMTPEAIAEAQRRARVCMESGYRDCD